MPKKHSPCIINLDDFGSEGNHWVCCFPSKDLLNCFDSFGMPYPEEYAKRALYRILYDTSQYQELTSVLCGYYCLYVLERLLVHKEKYYDILKVFNNDDQKDNGRFIVSYYFYFPLIHNLTIYFIFKLFTHKMILHFLT